MNHSLRNMKKIAIIALLLFSFRSLSAQQLQGNWEGELNVNGNGIPIVFHISKLSDGSFKASFDSPKQMAFDLPCDEVIVQPDSITIMMSILKGHFAAKPDAGFTTLNGRWYQGNMSMPLLMKRTGDVTAVKAAARPQTPKAPFPYISEDIQITNNKAGIQLGATFTYPAKDPNVEYFREPIYPVVILITGSGQQDRDETLAGHKPFAVIADYLSRRGIAVLRMDDRGTGTSTGNFAISSSYDFATDVEAAIDYLRKRKETDTTQLGLVGHSEGAMIAPLVAAHRKEVKFIVMMAGPGIPIPELMEEQIGAVALSQGASAASAKAGGQLFKMIANELIKTGDTATLKRKAIAAAEKWAAQTDKKILAEMEMTTAAVRAERVADQTAELFTPWYKNFLAFDAAKWLQQLDCRVLALNGEKDIQVLPKSNLAGIRSALQKSRSKDYKIIERPGLNHLFQNCKKCSAEEYGELEETIDTATLEIISDWIKQ